jgi:hypothetical protein
MNEGCEDMSKAYFQYYETFEKVTEKLPTLDQREHFRKAVVNYGLYGTEPDGMDMLEEMAWTICKELIDQQRHRREVNAENAAKAKPEAKPAARFKKPSVEEIAEYCKTKKYAIDARHFYNYYEANGWKVGRNAMKSWQATLANWAARDKAKGTIYGAGSPDADTAKYVEAFGG